MARLDVPDVLGGEAVMIWTLRLQLGGMIERMIRGTYQQNSPAGRRTRVSRKANRADQPLRRVL
ncbi:hypothetical protein DIJ64_10975 [Mycobacterium leprae]|uniref:Uncharacterized protein n=1 Tax=Mycobacterium leprae TaxID=1769 RepID=A0AAD0KWJ9_MYCLR|nr:hypothetical protein [Mycobacterium leprae]AWV48400.1 hypothetical protein DIJ64_10975 [Mycobacterium leprae]OAR20802.1 hypothetical protein A8144_02015 [Mycobacterium leprae 3125609]OAX72005.1 hypothetical protein A3216_02095 [Mycobacterium leprae 7935681]